MLGGNDMNVFGAATQGKNVEKKTVAETFLAGHGSPFVAQVSIANAPKLYRAILDGIEYRGTAFLQCFTTCQPEHGVADDMALTQAQRVRDSRGAPEFVFNPRLGETYQEALDVKGNPSLDMDWFETRFKGDERTVSLHRRALVRDGSAFQESPEEDEDRTISPKLIPLENMLVRITQQDVVYRRYLVSSHRSYRARLRRLHHDSGGQRRGGIPVALTSAGALLRRATEGVADAPEQGGHRKSGVQGTAIPAGRRRCREDFEGGFPGARRSDVEGTAAGCCRPQTGGAKGGCATNCRLEVESGSRGALGW